MVHVGSEDNVSFLVDARSTLATFSLLSPGNGTEIGSIANIENLELVQDVSKGLMNQGWKVGVCLSGNVVSLNTSLLEGSKCKLLHLPVAPTARLECSQIGNVKLVLSGHASQLVEEVPVAAVIWAISNRVEDAVWTIGAV